MTLTILLTIVGITIFLVGAYYMGNFMLDTLKSSDTRERIMNTLFGIMCWFCIAVIILIFIGIFKAIEFLLTH